MAVRYSHKVSVDLTKSNRFEVAYVIRKGKAVVARGAFSEPNRPIGAIGDALAREALERAVARGVLDPSDVTDVPAMYDGDPAVFRSKRQRAATMAKYKAWRNPAKRKRMNPSPSDPYEAGKAVGKRNAETAVELLDSRAMRLREGESRADRIAEYAEIESFENADEIDEFSDSSRDWEAFKRGVVYAIDRVIDKDAAPQRNPARKRR